MFWLLRLPLPWMLGAMSACAIAAMAGLPVGVPRVLRAVMIVVLGVMLGSAFTPTLFDRIGEWLATIAGMAAYVVLAGGMVYVYFRRVAHYGPITAFFTAMPGGLNEMILVGTAMGGDDRLISLSHGVRVMIVVFVLVFGFRFFAGYEPVGIAGGGARLADIAAPDLLILAASGALGAAAAIALRLPAAPLLGAMAVSAAVHLAGVTDSRPPGELVAVAQVVVGSAVGSRFAGVRFALIARAARHAVVAAALMLGAAAAIGAAVAAITGIPGTTLLLAYAPGGLAEMSLVAIALGADAAFVATHHIIRIMIVITLAPPFFRRIGRRKALPSERAPDDD